MSLLKKGWLKSRTYGILVTDADSTLHTIFSYSYYVFTVILLSPSGPL